MLFENFSNCHYNDIIFGDSIDRRKASCMNVNKLMEQKAVTKYRLSQNSGVPYTTVCDICNGKTKLENCSVKTVYKIAEALGVSMESLLDFYLKIC